MKIRLKILKKAHFKTDIIKMKNKIMKEYKIGQETKKRKLNIIIGIHNQLLLLILLKRIRRENI